MPFRIAGRASEFARGFAQLNVTLLNIAADRSNQGDNWLVYLPVPQPCDSRIDGVWFGVLVELEFGIINQRSDRAITPGLTRTRLHDQIPFVDAAFLQIRKHVR